MFMLESREKLSIDPAFSFLVVECQETDILTFSSFEIIHKILAYHRYEAAYLAQRRLPVA